MNRTDIHRPSSPDFDPQAYRCVGVFDSSPEWDAVDPFRVRQAIVNRLLADGYAAGPGSSTQCGHCGAHIRYGALMVRDDFKEFIYVGETCLDGRFEMTKADFDSLRKTASLNREQHAKREAVSGLYRDNPIMVWATYGWNIAEAGPEVGDYARTMTDDSEAQNELSFMNRTRTGRQFAIISDISSKARRYGSVSSAQVALVERLFSQIEAAATRLTTRETDNAALLAAGVKAPSGRVVVTGQVVAQKTQESQYGTTYKMLVVTAAGWKVWVTEPASINPNKGDTVRFTATLTPSDDDALFAFGKRPANAEILTGE